MTQAGIPVTWYDGWATRNRNGHGRDGWGRTATNPTGVHGVMLHHTVTRNVLQTVSIVRDIGQPENDVPPPLYLGVVDKAGRLHQVAWGRTNHAGLGDVDVLRAVINEQPAPKPNENNTDGNARFYGFAGINMGDGRDPWPVEQLNTMATVAALLCHEHGWTHNSVIGHHQWTSNKVDPRGPEGFLSARLRQLVHGKLS